jgi:hypothetical protein
MNPDPPIVRTQIMTVFYAILAVLLEFATILAFIALVVTPIYAFLEKTTMGARFKDMTPWMGWTAEETIEDPYAGFKIHRSNFIKSPSH